MRTKAQIIEDMCNFAVGIAENDAHGYSQSNRWLPDVDCSSLMYLSAEYAGLPVKNANVAPWYTRTMRQHFTAQGFEVITSLASRKRGDILLNDANHTALYLGGNMLVHARINENGGIFNGRAGDQTGREVCTQTYFDYPWNCILRYTGGEVSEEEYDNVLNIDGVRGVLTISRWQKILDTFVDGRINPFNSPLIKADQRFLNSVLKNKIVPLAIDGNEGKKTISARQLYLNTYGEKLVIDGVLGRLTNSAHQRALNKAKIKSKKY